MSQIKLISNLMLIRYFKKLYTIYYEKYHLSQNSISLHFVKCISFQFNKSKKRILLQLIYTKNGTDITIMNKSTLNFFLISIKDLASNTRIMKLI